MSGMTKMPFFSRISSAAAVVGPFAPSQMIFALICGAFLRVMTFSVAAGTSTSHSTVSRASLLIGSPLGYPASWRCSLTHSSMSGMSSPWGLCTAPDLSDTATIIAPSLAIRSAATEPTFPNPCTATRAPLRLMPSLASASRATNMHPRPAFRHPERDVHECALPGHPGGERLHFLERHVEIEPDPPLGRTAGGVVEHPVARVDLQLARIAQHGDRHDDLFFGVAEDLVEPGIEVQKLGRVIEALHHRLERVVFREERVLIGSDAGVAQGLDGRFAHGARLCVGSQARGAEASTASTACSSARPLCSQWTVSTATRGSGALPGH